MSNALNATLSGLFASKMKNNAITFVAFNIISFYVPTKEKITTLFLNFSFQSEADAILCLFNYVLFVSSLG